MGSKLQLRAYQERGVTFGLRHMANYKMVDLGLGKTVMELKTAEYTKIPIIVFAPLRVAYLTWPDEIKKWTPNLSFTILHGKKKDEKLKLKRDVYIINYDGLKWFFLACSSGKFPLRKYRFIFDESSFVKDPSTQRFKIFRKMMGIVSQNRSCLSATPASNGYHYLWSQYYLLDQGARLGAYYTPFRDKFFMYYPPPRNATIPKPFAELEIQERIRDITFRLDQKDHLELPPLNINDIKLDLPPAIRNIYNQMKKDSVLQFSDTQTATAFFDAARNNKCRQIVQGGVYVDKNPNERVATWRQLHDAKAQILKEMVAMLPGKNIITCIQYRFELDIIQKVLKYKVPHISGTTGATESTNTLHRWNAGKIPLLLVHPASISHGLNLQSAGHTMIWLALPWSLEQYQQTIGRLHRQGQQNAVTVHRIIFKNTVDDIVAQALSRKDATQRGLLDALKEEFSDDGY